MANFKYNPNFIDELSKAIFLKDDGITQNSEESIIKTIISELDAIVEILSLVKNYFGVETFETIFDFVCEQSSYNTIKANLNNDYKKVHYQDKLSGYRLLNEYQKLQSIFDKKAFGQYYTPQRIVELILNSLNLPIETLSKYRVLDPSCGGGAFFLGILDVCKKQGLNKNEVIEIINNSLYGFDLNPNALFLAKLCLIIHLKYLYDDFIIDKDIHLIYFGNKFIQCNTLAVAAETKFDYIIGNPPYFKIKQSLQLKEKYGQYLYGQGNVYALFLIWALNNISDSGKISFIIPQSIKNGNYFIKIREELSCHNIFYLAIFDSKKRKSVFNNVEQAVFIIGYEKSYDSKNQTLIINFDEESIAYSKSYQQSKVFDKEGFLTPQNVLELRLLNKLKRQSKFIEVFPDLKFGNGLFVWNQQKAFLSDEGEGSDIPIIYANYIGDNNFMFSPSKNIKIRKPYAKIVKENQNFVCSGIKLLVKRTSSNEKFFRIKACALDKEFIQRHEKYFVENHLNMLYNVKNKNLEINYNTILYVLAFLMSNISNYYIKQLNGNTQVSANELNALPFKIYKENEIVSLMQNADRDWNRINQIFYEAFQLNMQEINLIESLKEQYK